MVFFCLAFLEQRANKPLFRHAADGGKQPQSQRVVKKKMKTAA